MLPSLRSTHVVPLQGGRGVCMGNQQVSLTDSLRRQHVYKRLCRGAAYDTHTLLWGREVGGLFELRLPPDETTVQRKTHTDTPAFIWRCVQVLFPDEGDDHWYMNHNGSLFISPSSSNVSNTTRDFSRVHAAQWSLKRPEYFQLVHIHT